MHGFSFNEIGRRQREDTQLCLSLGSILLGTSRAEGKRRLQRCRVSTESLAWTLPQHQASVSPEQRLSRPLAVSWEGRARDTGTAEAQRPDVSG